MPLISMFKSRYKLLIYFILLSSLCNANMSSPIREGTIASSAISSKDINILSEKIYINPDKEFKTAMFVIEYNIQSEIAGKQIPLLFYAMDYKDGFSVWIDNQKVTVQNVDEQLYENTPFAPFSNSFEKQNDNDEVVVRWDNHSRHVCKLNDLKYFETDIAKGNHKVRVEYLANAWADISGWIKKYSFQYSLSPAKYWKSFGRLDIFIEQKGELKNITTNLGKYNEKETQALNSWSFTKLPGDYFEISYTPTPGIIAGALIGLQPFGIFLIATVLLFFAHFYMILYYRRKNIHKKYSAAMNLGSLLVPLLSILSYIYSYDLIDNAIGEDAGRHHGYVFLTAFLYPFFLIFYWMAAWLIDILYKKKLTREYKNQ